MAEAAPSNADAGRAQSILRAVSRGLLGSRHERGSCESLHIDLLGVDSREGAGIDDNARWLEGMVPSLVERFPRLRKCVLRLGGPSVTSSERVVRVARPEGVECEVRRCTGVCDDWWTDIHTDEWETERAKRLCVAFHPGFWGYGDTWKSTVCRATETGCPILTTAYTLEEAEDDEDTVRGWVAKDAVVWLWEAEENPEGARNAPIGKCPSTGRALRENFAWMAWRGNTVASKG